MSTQNGGGPAFPTPKDAGFYYGMDVRQYAIVHFMAALMQRKEFDIQRGLLVKGDVVMHPRFLAAEQADAMLGKEKP